MFKSWITMGTDTPFYSRKEFEVKAGLKGAEIKICGLGQFELHINGQKVGDHELDPAWTDYNKIIAYVTFDVTTYLTPGKNVLGAEVGNGWYIKNDEHYTFSFPPFMPPNPNPYKPFGKSLVLALELTMTYEDGHSEILTADDSFRVKKHPVIQSNVYGSETIDFALFQKGWDKTDFDDSSWEKAILVSPGGSPKGDLIEQINPPCKVIKSYQGKFLTHIDSYTCELMGNETQVPNRDIYDLSQNFSGLLSVSVKGKKGDVVRLLPAEKLNSKCDIDQVMKGWCLLDNVITIIIGEEGVWESFRQKFTYFSGRYVAVEKSSPSIEIKELEADAISSAWKKSGSFTSSDMRFNQIYDMVEKSVEANMVSVHTDCPTIERFAWQEPNHLMAPSIMFMKDGRKLWEKFLLDMRAGQHTAADTFKDFEGNSIPAGDGLVPSQAPCYIPNVLPVPGTGSFYDIIAWGSSLILGARWHYRFYGDEKILKDNFDAGLRYLEYLKTKVTPEGFINHGLGDWGNPEKEYARENIETAFLYADTIALMEAATILGKDEIAADLKAYADTVKENYNNRLLVQKDGHYLYKSYEHGETIVTTQAIEALPLYFGMVPGNLVDDIVLAFRNTLEEKGHFTAGEVGLPYVIQTARQYGMNELIARYILSDQHPSYYAFVKSGMTTLGEYWEENPRSHCHDMMGHIIEWFYNGIAGINPVEPGFKKVKITPWMPDSMEHFRCNYDTPLGTIVMEGKRENGTVTYNTEIPDGISVID